MITIKKLLVDCDPGIDDALALIYALGSKGVRLQGISAVYGNAHVEQTLENLLKVLELASPKKLPSVGIGSEGPLKGSRIRVCSAHGRDGLGDTHLPTPKIRPNIQDATGLFVSLVESRKVDVLVALGPLTDVAQFVEHCPDAARKLKKIFVMAGALRNVGSVTRYAEFNAYSDPWALGRVINSGLPVTVVSLDVTRTAIVRMEDLAEIIKSEDNPRSDFISGGLTYYIRFNENRRRAHGAYMHDPLCMALAMDERLGEYEDLSIGVKCSGDKRGMFYLRRGRPNVRFCTKVHAKRFLHIFLNSLRHFIKG